MHPCHPQAVGVAKLVRNCHEELQLLGCGVAVSDCIADTCFVTQQLLAFSSLQIDLGWLQQSLEAITGMHNWSSLDKELRGY